MGAGGVRSFLRGRQRHQDSPSPPFKRCSRRPSSAPLPSQGTEAEHREELHPGEGGRGLPRRDPLGTTAVCACVPSIPVQKTSINTTPLPPPSARSCPVISARLTCAGLCSEPHPPQRPLQHVDDVGQDDQADDGEKHQDENIQHGEDRAAAGAQPCPQRRPRRPLRASRSPTTLQPYNPTALQPRSSGWRC